MRCLRSSMCVARKARCLNLIRACKGFDVGTETVSACRGWSKGLVKNRPTSNSERQCCCCSAPPRGVIGRVLGDL